MLTNTAFIIAILAIALGFLASLVCLLVFMGKWVHSDAKERGMDNAALWVLVVLLVPNLIGLVIYLVVRSNHGRKTACPSCGFAVADSSGFCPRCGAQQPPITQMDLSAAPSKAKKNLRRFLISLGLMVLMMILLIVSAVFVSYQSAKIGSESYLTNHSTSLVEWTFDHEFRQKVHRQGNDSAELTFASFRGEYELLTFHTDGGSHAIQVSANSEGQPLTLSLRDLAGDEIDLPEGESTHSLLEGRYTIVMRSDGCEDGEIQLQVRLDK